MERTINKVAIMVVGGSILADILTHGQVSTDLAKVISGIIKTALQATSGQNIS